MNKADEIKAEIRNKLTPAKTALDLLAQGKEVSKEFIEMAEKSLDEAIKMLESRQREGS